MIMIKSTIMSLNENSLKPAIRPKGSPHVDRYERGPKGLLTSTTTREALLSLVDRYGESRQPGVLEH